VPSPSGGREVEVGTLDGGATGCALRASVACSCSASRSRCELDVWASAVRGIPRSPTDGGRDVHPGASARPRRARLRQRQAGLADGRRAARSSTRARAAGGEERGGFARRGRRVDPERARLRRRVPRAGRPRLARRVDGRARPIAKRDVHVVPSENGWRVEVAADGRARSVHATQAEARLAAREIARRTKRELFVHGRDARSASATPTARTRAPAGVEARGAARAEERRAVGLEPALHNTNVCPIPSPALMRGSVISGEVRSPRTGTPLYPGPIREATAPTTKRGPPLEGSAAGRRPPAYRATCGTTPSLMYPPSGTGTGSGGGAAGAFFRYSSRGSRETPIP
jgi:hypothetical protein